MEVCSKIKEDIITSIDACMAQIPQKRDIIAIYMETVHIHLMDVLTYYWEKKAVKTSAFDTLTIVDWCYIYLKDLKNYGITDMYL